jgi:hypothetical protein
MILLSGSFLFGLYSPPFSAVEANPSLAAQRASKAGIGCQSDRLWSFTLGRGFWRALGRDETGCHFGQVIEGGDWKTELPGL